jgi:hypothetical protein
LADFTRAAALADAALMQRNELPLSAIGYGMSVMK